jgi:two-component system LytT family sensor kinase
MINHVLIRPWLYKLMPILIWFLILILPFATSPAPANVSREQHERFLLSIVISNTLLLCIFYIHTFLAYPLLQRQGWGWYLLLLFTLLGLYWFLWYFVIPQPPMHGPFNPTITQAGDRQTFAPKGPPSFIPVLSPFIALLCSFCYRVLLDSASREQLIKDRETVHLRTELNFLRSQISPHFMFNVLNSLVLLARKKSDGLEPAIVNLSQLMRYMLYETDDNSVPLHKELDYLNSYIKLQQLRFGKTVQVSLKITGNPQPFAIEPMLLIPFVENAFKHGPGLDDEAVILIMLDIDEQQRQLHFKAINSINRQNQSKDHSSGIGLGNVKRRLDILYPGKHQLSFSNHENSFTIALTIGLD